MRPQLGLLHLQTTPLRGVEVRHTNTPLASVWVAPASPLPMVPNSRSGSRCARTRRRLDVHQTHYLVADLQQTVAGEEVADAPELPGHVPRCSRTASIQRQPSPSLRPALLQHSRRELAEAFDVGGSARSSGFSAANRSSSTVPAGRLLTPSHLRTGCEPILRILTLRRSSLRTQPAVAVYPRGRPTCSGTSNCRVRSGVATNASSRRRPPPTTRKALPSFVCGTTLIESTRHAIPMRDCL